MSLRDQLVTDLREVVFNANDFAHTVTYSPATGDDYSINGIFDNSYQQVEPNSGAIITSTHPKFLTAQAFIRNGGTAKGDQIVFNGITYNIKDKQPRGLHLIDLLLLEA